MFKMGGSAPKTFSSVMSDFQRVRDDLLEVSVDRGVAIDGLIIVKADIEREIGGHQTEKDQCDRTISKFDELLGIE